MLIFGYNSLNACSFISPAVTKQTLTLRSTFLEYSLDTVQIHSNRAD